MLFFPFTRSKPAPREVSLPIHPLETLEDWVGAVHFALADGTLSDSEQARMLDQIALDPAAASLFRQFQEDEAMIARYFADMPEKQPVSTLVA